MPNNIKSRENKPTPWALLIACTALAIAMLALILHVVRDFDRTRLDAKLRQHQIGMTATVSTAVNGTPEAIIQGNTIRDPLDSFFPSVPGPIHAAKYMHQYKPDMITTVIQYYDENDRIIFVYVGRT